MMIALSVLLGILPLFGIAWTAEHGDLTTVGGLFLTLILLALAAIMFLNVGMELRNLRKKAH
jgi:amino acid transporter